MLDALTELSDSDPLIWLLFGIVAIALLLAILMVVVLWPLDRIRVEDRLDHPFGDMPLPPREWR